MNKVYNFNGQIIIGRSKPSDWALFKNWCSRNKDAILFLVVAAPIMAGVTLFISWKLECIL